MFENTTELIYLGIRSGLSKAQQPYRVLVVGNPDKYENYEFFVPDGLTLPALQVNDPINIQIELSKRNYNLVPSLAGVSKAHAPAVKSN